MKLEEIRERASVVGLAGAGKLRKAELIRKIQQAEGNDACYGAEWRRDCAEMHCCWRPDCMKE